MQAKLQATLKKEQEKFRSEKQIIMKAMQDKDTKMEGLSKLVKEREQQLAFVQQQLPSDERELKLKLQDQQKQLGSLNQMFKLLDSQNKLLNQKNVALEEKLKKKQSQIDSLETKLEITTQQVITHKN